MTTADLAALVAVTLTMLLLLVIPGPGPRLPLLARVPDRLLLWLTALTIAVVLAAWE